MTRIISGLAGSLTLAVPDAGTRPTSDRVRESLFGALEAGGLLAGARVLDLYAGSGALALESLSRGAVAADLVERHARAAGVAERNVRTVLRAVPGVRARVHRVTSDQFLRGASGTYDVAFLDPPYDVGEDELTNTLTLLLPRLSADAVVLIERDARSPEPDLPGGLVTDRSKRYGDTAVWWARPAMG